MVSGGTRSIIFVLASASLAASVCGQGLEHALVKALHEITGRKEPQGVGQLFDFDTTFLFRKSGEATAAVANATCNDTVEAGTWRNGSKAAVPLFFLGPVLAIQQNFSARSFVVDSTLSASGNGTLLLQAYALDHLIDKVRVEMAAVGLEVSTRQQTMTRKAITCDSAGSCSERDVTLPRGFYGTEAFQVKTEALRIGWLAVAKKLQGASAAVSAPSSSENMLKRAWLDNEMLHSLMQVSKTEITEVKNVPYEKLMLVIDELTDRNDYQTFFWGFIQYQMGSFRRGRILLIGRNATIYLMEWIKDPASNLLTLVVSMFATAGKQLPASLLAMWTDKNTWDLQSHSESFSPGSRAFASMFQPVSE